MCANYSSLTALSHATYMPPCTMCILIGTFKFQRRYRASHLNSQRTAFLLAQKATDMGHRLFIFISDGTSYMKFATIGGHLFC
jgi:hypothetical protein